MYISKRFLLLLAIGVLSVFMLYFLMFDSTREAGVNKEESKGGINKERAAASPSNIPRLQHAIASRAVNRLEERVSEIENELAGNADQDDEDSDELDGPDVEQEVIERNHQRFESNYQKEGVDYKWASQLETQINDVFSDEEFQGVRLLGISCKSSICKMEVEYDELEKQNSFMQTFPSKTPGMSGWWRQTGKDEESGLKTLFYLMKP